MIKRFAIFGLFLFFSSIASSQQLSGIGVFKIGMNQSTFDSWVNDNQIKVVVVDSQSVSFGSSKNNFGETDIKIIQVSASTPDKRDWYYYPGTHFNINRLGDYNSYLVIDFTVGDIVFDPIELVFKKNTLVAIKTNLKTQIIEAFNAKFGAPKLVEKYTRKLCVYSFTGAPVRELYDKETTMLWASPSNISAGAEEFVFHDDGCKRGSSGSVLIEIKGAYTKFERDNANERERMKKIAKSKANQELKSKLNDL